jgi:hypothetical protein
MDFNENELISRSRTQEPFQRSRVMLTAKLRS